jgi:bacillithiol system protein YtxJ
MHLSWKELNNEFQLDQLIIDSRHKPVLIFKHSNRCGISFHVLEDLKNQWNNLAESIDFYYIDLLNFRNISNEVAERFQVIHQSPQVILLHHGKVIYHMSHYGISTSDIKKSLQKTGIEIQ